MSLPTTSIAATKYLLSLENNNISVEGKINERCKESFALNYSRNIIIAAYGLGS